MNEQAICNRCILDSSVPGVHFDERGICNHCSLHDKLEDRYAINESSRGRFASLVEEIKSRGRKEEHDCIVGLSGGTDSTYSLYVMKELGLRPLAVHVDNGWVSEAARDNVARTVKKLNVDLRTFAWDWERLREYYLACLRASIPETCLVCEVAGVSSLYQAAAEEDVGYIIWGTSFRTEGINPLRWHYVDGAYLEDVVKRFGRTEIEGLNRMKALDLLNYIFIRRIKSIQLPLYIEYRNEDIWRTLAQELEWEYGGRQHFDCLYKPFGAYVEINRFERDPRKITLSALVRSGQLTREEALNELHQDRFFEDEESIEYCLQKLGLTREDLRNTLSSEPRNFLDYRTYYPILRMLRIPVRICCRLNLLHETLYEKMYELV
jgi:N-acetyl sugar amidotransferase